MLSQNDYLWLTRVPETLKESKALVEKDTNEIDWQVMEKGYKIANFISHYGGIEQRWLLVYSEQAYKREQKTVEKNLKKKEEELKKTLWHLGNEIFCCEKDAKEALQLIAKKNPLHLISHTVVAEMKYAKKGRPKLGDEQIIAGYKIVAEFGKNAEAIARLLNKKGRFILATNDLERANYTDQMMLEEYKEQQNVEGGFRFLKDPWFMVDSIFLKSPKRIEALMMVMTLCLMVYNIAQYKLRQSLKDKNETLPNQLKKPVQNPTMRWIFQIMEGIGVVKFFTEYVTSPIRSIVSSLSDLRKKIILLFGTTACRIYGLI